jgi:hypothetical protein
MTNEENFTIAVNIFPVPANPGPSATVVAGMTAAVIAETTRLHREATQVYHTYHNVDQAIKKLIIESFDDAYLNALSDEIVGHANCTSLQLLTHLVTYFAMIAPTELTQNYERLNTPYDPKAYVAAMIDSVAYTLVFNTGLFPDACRAWKSRAIATKTWAQFKINFATAHCKFRLTNQTAQQSGFHSANMMIEQGRDDSMQETAEAIAQLDTATASDRGTVATLTPHILSLHQLEAAHALIAQLKSEIAKLKNKIKSAWQGQRPSRTTNNDSYCWSHGYQEAKSCTSATCNVTKNGHQESATKIYIMGGVQWGKE